MVKPETVTAVAAGTLNASALLSAAKRCAYVSLTDSTRLMSSSPPAAVKESVFSPSVSQLAGIEKLETLRAWLRKRTTPRSWPLSARATAWSKSSVEPWITTSSAALPPVGSRLLTVIAFVTGTPNQLTISWPSQLSRSPLFTSAVKKMFRSTRVNVYGVLAGAGAPVPALPFGLLMRRALPMPLVT